MALFQRYRATHMSLHMNPMVFQTLDLTSLPTWMAEEAKSVLTWALASLYADTWLRADYKSCLLLLIFVLGGQLKDFTVPFPPPDHHARWMSKVIVI